MHAESELMFAGPIGRMRPEDVLQFAAQTGGAVRISFETFDRALGGPRGVDLEVDGGRLVALGPRGTGLRFGDLAVARGVIARGDLETLAQGGGPRLGERLVAAGRLDAAGVEDLLWERHARVVWSLLSWDRGSFSVRATLGPDMPPALEGETPHEPVEAETARVLVEPDTARILVEPPIPLSALLLDGLQRAESALGPAPS